MMIKRGDWLTIEYNFVILDSFYAASDLKISEFTQSFQWLNAMRVSRICLLGKYHRKQKRIC